MKRPLFIVFLLILYNNIFGQIDTLKFEQFGDSVEFSELNLNPDKTFDFHHYNIRSCYTWYSVHGSWKKDNGNIFFKDTIRWEEDNLQVDTSINNTDFILITVKGDNGKPLQGIQIEYNLFWADKPNTYLTDKNGEIKINKTVIPKQRHKESNKGEVHFVIFYSNRKSSQCSMSTGFDTAYDRIDLIIIDNPKQERIVRTTTYKIDNGDIYFQAQTYTGDKGYVAQSWGNFRKTARQ